MAKFKLEFSGLEEYAARLEKLGGDLKKTTEKALEKTSDYVTPNVEEAFKKHDVKYSHDTMKSLTKDKKVEWSGTTGSINVGFDISRGGLPSVFLMYGTPKIKPDKNLYNSIYGSATKKAVKKIQEEIFKEEISKL